MAARVHVIPSNERVSVEGGEGVRIERRGGRQQKWEDGRGVKTGRQRVRYGRWPFEAGGEGGGSLVWRVDDSLILPVSRNDGGHFCDLHAWFVASVAGSRSLPMKPFEKPGSRRPPTTHCRRSRLRSRRGSCTGSVCPSTWRHSHVAIPPRHHVAS
jgi:hypothetical protein